MSICVRLCERETEGEGRVIDSDFIVYISLMCDTELPNSHCVPISVWL